MAFKLKLQENLKDLTNIFIKYETHKRFIAKNAKEGRSITRKLSKLTGDLVTWLHSVSACEDKQV